MAVLVDTHTLTEESYDIASNTSTVRYLLKLKTTEGSYNVNNITTTYYIDGVKYTVTHKLPYRTTTTVIDKTVTISHNSDGTRSVTASYSVPTNISAGTMTGTKTTQLTTIPRTTSITSFSVSKRNETSLTFNWQTADTIDYVWYSTNGGSSWTGYDVTDGTSGSFIVSGLSANTSYNCKLRVRRKDSQLTTDSNTVSQTTYAIPTQSFSSKTETTVTMNWSCDDTVDYVWYSKDNGSNWTAVGSVNAKSGSYTISGLSANTSYNIKTRLRRKTPQTNYDTTASSQTTYQYPYVSSVGTSSLTIGNSQTLSLYNPLGRSCTVYMKKDSTSGTELYSGTTSGTSITFTPTASTLYNSIPSAQSGNCVYYCVYSSPPVTTKSGTYKITGNEKPTAGTLTYADQNSTVVGITQNNQHIVRNNSSLRVTYGAATANNGSSISSYQITFNGSTQTKTAAGYIDYGTVNLSSSATVTVKVTDSRGLYTTYSKTITILDWVLPTAIITLNRVNNYEDTTNIKVVCSISSVNSKNTIKSIKYKFKKTSDSGYSSQTSINNNQAYTITKDKAYAWNFQFEIKDEFGTTTYNLILGKGAPILFIDTKRLAVGVNCFPGSDNSLALNGQDVLEYEVVDTW